MKKDKFKTDVIFRKWRTGDNTIMALFPHTPHGRISTVESYEHIGQHGGADYCHCIHMTTPAKENEYKDLFEELESIGYNLNIIKKQNYKKYLKSYYGTING